MFTTILLSCIAFWVALLPVYLWGYGVSALLDTPWNRKRFLLGMMIGGLSVGIVWIFSYMEHAYSGYWLLCSILFILAISACIFLLIRQGSNIARGILKKFTSMNIAIILSILIGSIMISKSLPSGTVLMLSVTPLLLSALIEESSKHLMSIGLMSQDFRFSRSDIIIFTLFVVLGFVFIENLLYLFQGSFSLSTWIFRSFFTLIAHLLSATVCAYAWWRAMSYEPFSYRYIAIFSSGFALAVLTHLGYNMILSQGSLIGVGIYMIMGYIVITQGIVLKK